MPNDKIEEIKQTLEAWERNEETHLQAHSRQWLRYLLEQNEQLASEQAYAKREAIRWNDEAVRLRDQNEQLQAEIETLKRVAADDHAVYKWNFVVLEDQLSREREEHAQSREENERLRGELQRTNDQLSAESKTAAHLRNELEQVKAERDDYRKVLEHCAERRQPSPVLAARNVLSRYKRGDSQ